MIAGPAVDFERCYRAVASRDARFDGWFFTAVATTGIYCRPSCPAITPKRQNVSFHPTAASAQAAGYRACKRCRPDASPGSPEWNLRGDVVARAMRLIADGVVDRDGVGGLANRLGYSERQLNRLLVAELGAGPLALARSQRAQTARTLIETTALPFADVAFAAGFASIRQFNDTVREVFARTPTELRSARKPGTTADGGSGAGGTVTLRLPYRQPFDPTSVLQFLGQRAIPGVETFDGARYRRLVRFARGPGVVALEPAAGHVQATLALTDLRDLASAVARCRRLLDLDADPVAIDAQLGADELLGPLVTKRPGMRLPGAVDGAELVVRAVVGQQVSVAGARTIAGRLAAAHGELVALDPDGCLTHTFPDAATLAAIDPTSLPMPRARGATLVALCAAVADGSVDLAPGADLAAAHAALLAHRGVGPWTADYVILRCFGDPDVFLPGDLGIRRALEGLGVDGSPKAAAARAEAWRPWRSYALLHLWATLSG